jgi:hypothetical protein
VQLQKLLSSTRYTLTESIFVVAPDTSQAKKNVKSELTPNSTAVGPVSSAGMPIDQLRLYSLIISRPFLRSNLFMAGYQSAFSNADTALQLISVHSAPNPKPHLTVPLLVPYNLARPAHHSAPEAPY